MVHERYVKRGGKLYGPYLYKSVRDEKGRVKNIYLGMPKKSVVQKNYNLTTIPYLIIITFFVLGFFFIQTNHELINESSNKIISTNKQAFELTGFFTKTQTPEYTPIRVKTELHKIRDHIILHANQKFYAQLEAKNLDQNSLKFSDTTNLFDITTDGIITFTPTTEQIGDSNMTVIFADDDNNFEYKIIKFTILE